ncbi:hypothetical protein ACM26V_01285 [Salipaludibacillus sp. HK11]|uniref:hypothetical protein n=1 Tax=Salipaludibacillus sp. HK11 TaxID=3394320 RepID=UPI0039FCC6D4
MTINRMITLAIILLISVSGCEQAGQKDFESQSVDNAEKISQTVAKEAEKIAEELEQVEEATAVSQDKDVYVHLKVSGFDRLFLKDVRKKAKDKLERANPDGKVEVSTDKKLELELTELKHKLSDQKISKKQLKDDLKKVDDDMKAGV